MPKEKFTAVSSFHRHQRRGCLKFAGRNICAGCGSYRKNLRQHRVRCKKYRDALKKQFKAKTEKKKSDENVTEQSVICRICYELPVEYCISPCGHLVCRECHTHLYPMGRCFVCRGEIEHCVKMYF